MIVTRDRYHRYSLDGAPVPSVTQVLCAAAPRPVSRDARIAMDRGTRVHATIAAILRGDAVRPALRPGDRPYVEAFSDWWQRRPMPVLAVEAMVGAPIGYAGQVDAVLEGPRGPMIWDWKTGAPAEWHGPQLAAYQSAARLQWPRAERWNLYLSPAGLWTPRQQDRPGDILAWWRAFQAYQTSEGSVTDATTEEESYPDADD